jgi:O-antigen ligase
MTGGRRGRPAARRLVAVVGALLIAALGTAALLRGPTVYTARAEIAFSPPVSLSSTAPYLHYVERMIEYTTLVSREYNDRYPTVQLSSPRATLSGNGVRDGISVRPSTTGPQWEPDFDRSVIVVTVNAPSAEEAMDRVAEAVVRAERVSTDLQDRASVPARQRITSSSNPHDIELVHAGRSAASTALGAGVLAVVAVALATALTRRPTDRAHLDDTALPRGLPVRGVPSSFYVVAFGSLGHPSTLWGLGGLVWWLTARASGSAGRLAPRSPVHLAFLALVASVAVSFAVVTLQGGWTGGQAVSSGLLRVLGWTGVFVVTASGIRTLDRLTVLLRRLVVAGACMAVLGLAQFTTGRSFVDTISLPGFASNQTFSNVVERGGFVRSAGTAAHPLEYGVLLAVTLVLAAGLAIHDRRRPWYLRWTPVALIGVAAAVSVSRSTLLAVAIGLVLLAPSVPRRYWGRAVVGGGVLGVAVAFLVPGMIGTIRGMFTTIESDPSAQSRTDSLDVALQIAERNPWFGTGYGSFLPNELIVDNQLLLFAVGTGIVGVAAFLGLVGTAVVCGWRVSGWRPDAHRTSTGPDGAWPLGASISAAVAAAASTTLFFDSLSFSISAGVLFLLLGAASAAWSATRGAVTVDRRRTDAAPGHRAGRVRS